MTIGKRLKEERERLQQTQAEFAALVAATKRSQINWEKGTAMPNAAYLAAIASAGADVNYILTGIRVGFSSYPPAPAHRTHRPRGTLARQLSSRNRGGPQGPRSDRLCAGAIDTSEKDWVNCPYCKTAVQTTAG